MKDWSRQRSWDDMAQSRIREGQQLHAQGQLAGAEAQFCAALEALVHGYQDAVIGFCRNMLRDHVERAEDIAQDVFLAAWKTLPRFRHDASLRTWVFAIARRQCLDALATPRSDTPNVHLHQEPCVAELPLDEQYAHQDTLAGMKRGLARLRSEDREILVLSYIAELPPTEIAHVLGIAPASVRTRRKRALQRLREVLKHAER